MTEAGMSIDRPIARHRGRGATFGRIVWSIVLAGCLCMVGCGPSGHGHAHDDGHGDGHGHDDAHGHDHAADGSHVGASAGPRWAVTAWGQHFEVFPEVGALVAGETSTAHVHVTALAEFAPLAEGTVECVLSSAVGEQVFRVEAPARPGIFNIPIEPTSPGDFDLTFRIQTPEVREEIRGGRVRVGADGQPGALLVAPAPKGGSGGEPVAFGKEEQWRSGFATAWVRRGALARSVQGLTRLRPPAGGETVLSSPLDGVVHVSGAWPYAGRKIRKGAPLFHIAPRVAAERSLAVLKSEASSLEIEKTAVLQRLARLEELLALEAISQRDVEEVRHQAEILAVQHAAAVRDLDDARNARQGGTAGALHIFAPFSGEIAEVLATPDATVAAGEALARLVRTDRVWFEVALSAVDAARLDSESVAGIVLSQGRREVARLTEDVSLVSVAPEASAATGMVSAFLESPAAPGLVLGTAMQGQVLLAATRNGIVIPATALIDDGGVAVVYLQLAGENFVRQEVRVVERQGDRILVEGLEPGQRLVTAGGDAIRRSSLMSSGGAHGHVH